MSDSYLAELRRIKRKCARDMAECLAEAKYRLKRIAETNDEISFLNEKDEDFCDSHRSEHVTVSKDVDEQQTVTKSRKRARSRSPNKLPPRPVGSVIQQTPSPVRCFWSVESPAQPGPFTAINRPSITHSELTPAASSTAATDRSSIALIIQMLPSYFEKSFKKMEEIQTAIEILQRKVDQLVATQNVASSHATPALPDGFIFPLQEVYQLERLNDTLAEEDTRQRMILYLSFFGGSTPKEALYRLLRHLLVPKLSILYSLEGRKGKRRFNSLQHLKAAIYEPIVKRYHDVTMADLDKYAREWLAISGDRDGGRKRREEKKLQSVSSTSF
ncbi:uncharacterized protein LOC112577159 [Pomacea canaliculata]|uniref:uncharacterized protein LOC112577159 n=1 Tax=Pomacea canaliculata TaxID=400727 RepID=UPI000D72E52E|nr:uncharacterized protein LOC112577159 [Pomacea canaliculata]